MCTSAIKSSFFSKPVLMVPSSGIDAVLIADKKTSRKCFLVNDELHVDSFIANISNYAVRKYASDNRLRCIQVACSQRCRRVDLEVRSVDSSTQPLYPLRHPAQIVCLPTDVPVRPPGPHLTKSHHLRSHGDTLFRAQPLRVSR